jgi:hypothetical protein
MDLYNVLFFVHMIGLISLFGALILIQNVGGRLRRAATWEQARALVDLLPPVRGMFIAGGVLLAASGGWMTAIGWSFEDAWISVAVAMLLIVAIAGAVAVSRMHARIRPLARDGNGPVPDDRALLGTRGEWSTIFAVNGLSLGTVWTMTVKPEWTHSIVVPLVLGLIGLLAGRAVVAPRRTTEATRRAFPRRQPVG